MATHFSSLAWEIPWTEEPGGYSPWGCKSHNMTEQLNHHHHSVSALYQGLLLLFSSAAIISVLIVLRSASLI